ncbi:MAG: hypothetical protein JWM78_3173 [Verrucomicrobiaceae bacterium]|nr:hypothetical protein [Verrucomicrobiaceae bacterium]
MLEPIKNYINDNYGSKRGLLNTSRSLWFTQIGGYKEFQDIDWDRVQRLIFICSGNICRSPLGDVYAKSKGYNAESFGLDCGDAYPADPRAINFGATLGLDLQGHRTRNIANYRPSSHDLLVGMEPSHMRPLEKYTDSSVQITLAGLWLDPVRPYLHDPYNACPAFFNKCEQKVVAATNNLLRKLKTPT